MKALSATSLVVLLTGMADICLSPRNGTSLSFLQPPVSVADMAFQQAVVL